MLKPLFSINTKNKKKQNSCTKFNRIRIPHCRHLRVSVFVVVVVVAHSKNHPYDHHQHTKERLCHETIKTCLIYEGPPPFE